MTRIFIVMAVLGSGILAMAVAAGATVAPCTSSDDALCLRDGRFEVRATWKANGQEGVGHAKSLTADTGTFWFFEEKNVEIAVKVLDGRPLNGAFWVFYGGLSNVEYTIDVTDTVSGERRRYFNPTGRFASVGDTQAFVVQGPKNGAGSLRSIAALPAPHGDEPGESDDGGVALSHVPCQDAVAHVYPCHKIDLLAALPLADLGAEEDSSGNDIWGWTDPQTGTEYALVGLADGMAIVDLRDPEHPLYLGKLPTQTRASPWRDIKVYRDHAFVVADAASGHGLQVLDLTQLRHLTTAPVLFNNSVHYAGFGSAHNLAINEATGFAYVTGTNTCDGGLHILDVREPKSPSFAGCYSQDGYTHDAQCVLYHGPDARYRGREVCFAFNEDTVTVVDVTHKNAPRLVSRNSYPGAAYTHQGWLTPNHGFLLVDDEGDELGTEELTGTYIWSVSDLEAPDLLGIHRGTTRAIDHNQYVHRGFVFQANYTSGLRVLDHRQIHLGKLQEVAHFDTFPEGEPQAFAGAWSVYPFFASGTIVVSDVNRGLFVLEPRVPGLNLPRTPTQLRAQVEDNTARLTWRDQADNETGFRIFRATGDAPLETRTDLGPDATRYVDKDLVPGLRYRYAVSAFNDKGESDRVEVEVTTPPVLQVCAAGARTLCLGQDRFRLELAWEDPDGNTGAGQAQPLTDDTGYFWYFDDANVEMVVKVLDGRALNSHFWVFYASLSNVKFTLTVIDTETGVAKQYGNPQGTFASVGDTQAFQ